MTGIRITITRYVSDEPQPGLVECELVDASGKRWTFVEKTAVVSTEALGPNVTYPRAGVIAVTVTGKTIDASGDESVRVSTAAPWGVESVGGTTEFDVVPDTLVTL